MYYITIYYSVERFGGVNTLVSITNKKYLIMQLIAILHGPIWHTWDKAQGSQVELQLNYNTVDNW